MNTLSKDTAHLTDHDLLLHLYGLAPNSAVPPAHIDSCPECRSRWLALSERRAAVLELPAATPALDARLRAQRAAICSRIENRPAAAFRLLPLAATAFMLVASIALHQPSPRVDMPEIAAVSPAGHTDEELFKEIALLANEDAPRVTVPIRGLFSEDRALEVQ